MDTKQLRQKILDLAIRGKLVPQDPNDEPAFALLERIREEKERLIKEGKIRRDKKGETSDTSQDQKVPFKVPEGWVWCKLGDIAYMKAGYFVKAEDIRNESQDELFPCYGGNGIRGYVESFTHEGLYTLIGRQGALCGNVNLAHGKFHATEHAVVTIPYCDINSLWLFYTLKILNLNQNSTGAAQPGLSVERINKVFIPIPPIPEKKRIVSVIESTFSLIDEIEANKLSLEKFIKQTKFKVLDLAIRGKLVPQDSNEEPASLLLERICKERKTKLTPSDISHYPFELPDSWMWCRLGELCDYGTCNSVRLSEIPDDAWVLDLEDIEKDSAILQQRVKKVERKTTSVRHSFLAGNVLYSKLRTYLNKVLVADIEGFCTTEILPLDFKGFVIPEYARHVLMSQMFLDYTAQCGYGVKMPRLGTNDGKKALFPLPPIAEQQRIVYKIKQIFDRLDEIEKVIITKIKEKKKE